MRSALLLTPIALAACATTPSDYARPFPADKPATQTVNIQVLRDQTSITFTNTTARSFPPGSLWLNQWYSRPLPALAIGETLNFPLREFRSEHDEPYPAGGFFATRASERLVSAQIETDADLVNLIVVAPRDQ
jgi:hypothetical protein